MAVYSGKPVTMARPIGEIYDKFADLTVFEEKLRQLPADQLAKIGDVKFERDSITINTPQMGPLTFGITERVAPTKIVFGSASSPVPLKMTVDLKEVTPDSTEINTAIDVEIPAMLKPFVGPKLQEAADKFGDMMTNLAR